MTINVEFWHLVGLLLSFLGCCFGFAKILVAQFQNSLCERHQNQFKVNETKWKNWKSNSIKCSRPYRSFMCCEMTTFAGKRCCKPKWMPYTKP